MPYVSAADFLKLLEPAILDAAQHVDLPSHANRNDLRLAVFESEGAILVAVTHSNRQIAPVMWPLFTSEDFKAPVLAVNLKARMTKILLDTITHQENVARLLGIDTSDGWSTDNLVYKTTERYSATMVDPRAFLGSIGK